MDISKLDTNKVKTIWTRQVRETFSNFGGGVHNGGAEKELR